jgi:uncharacterized protein YdaU (DUF1376 family)
MGTRKKQTQRNGQEYQPQYQFWHEQDFSADEQVAYGMDWLQRHFYRTLLQKAFICSTRPYLPNSDDQLWLLADAGSKDRWLENKEAVMVKFQRVEINGVEFWAHKRLLRDWALLVKYRTEKAKAGRAGGLAKAGNRRAASSYVSPEAPPIDGATDDGLDADESAV